MKEFVVGAPYTTETELTEDDELLILACDGVRNKNRTAIQVAAAVAILAIMIVLVVFRSHDLTAQLGG